MNSTHSERQAESPAVPNRVVVTGPGRDASGPVLHGESAPRVWSTSSAR